MSGNRSSNGKAHGVLDGWHIQPTEATLAAHWKAVRKLFTPDEMAVIVRDAQGLTTSEGAINPLKLTKDQSVRSSLIRWLPKEFGWVYERMMSVAVKLNRQLWRYDLTGARDQIQFTEYFATENGHYDWHFDMGDGPSSFRKLSVAVQLNDDYEGGEFELQPGNHAQQVLKEAGTAVVFPSWMLHRVKPVTKGERRSLVLWVCGPPLR